MRRSLTALGSAILTPHECDRPDPDDPMIQAMAHEYGLSAEYIADEAERTFNTIFTRKGERAPLEDVLAAMHAVMRNSVKRHSDMKRGSK